MEVLVPVVIVAIIIGLLFVVLRRPAIVRPPTDASAPKTTETASALKSDKIIEEIFNELKDAPPDGTKRVTIMKGKNQIGWAVTRRVEQTSLSPDDLRRLGVGGNMEQVARDLLAKLEPGSSATDAPPEAELQYPGSALVVNSFESKRASDSAAEPRDVYKTTLATEADSAQVVAWYREWLLDHGWQPSPSAGTNAASSQEYVRESEHFRLAVADPATLAPILALPIPAGTKTVYEVEYSNASTQPPTP